MMVILCDFHFIYSIDDEISLALMMSSCEQFGWMTTLARSQKQVGPPSWPSLDQVEREHRETPSSDYLGNGNSEKKPIRPHTPANWMDGRIEELCEGLIGKLKCNWKLESVWTRRSEDENVLETVWLAIRNGSHNWAQYSRIAHSSPRREAIALG